MNMEHDSVYLLPWTNLWISLGYTWVLVTILHTSDAVICTGFSARNYASSLEPLRGCTVVEGRLEIVLMEYETEKGFEPYSFPELREITHYLMLFRVKGLRSLGKLFPNLEKIGGVEQFESFSLIVYQMFGLQEIGLYSLREISTGSVMIKDNTDLCFVNTVQWGKITKWNADYNKLQNECNCPPCPACPANCPNACWNASTCQDGRISKGCDQLCLGGCDPDNPHKCHTCRGFFDLNGKCVSNCSENTYQYLNRRCVTREECLNSTIVLDQDGGVNSPVESRVISEDKCLDSCPSGVEPNAGGVCPPCNGQCANVCKGETISTTDHALKFKGCGYIDGSLVINIMTDMTEEVQSDLEDGLGSIQLISGYLQVTRSSVVNLNFLKNLSWIYGFDDNKPNISLVVTRNKNLRELWDWNTKKKLVIANGRVQFYSNPKLCLEQIKKLAEVITWYNDTVNSSYIDNHSNGDDFQCHPIRVNITVSEVTSSTIRVHIPFADTPPVLRYVVYYLKDIHGNVTMFNGFAQCYDDGWRTIDVSVDSGDVEALSQGTDIVLPDLEPYTTYVFYVSAYTIYNNGSRSGMYRRATLPSTPSEIIGLGASAYGNSISLTWEPPRRVNGKLEEYVISWYELSEDELFINQRNYCDVPLVEPGSKTQQNMSTDDFEMMCGSFKNVPTALSDRNKYLSCKSFFYAHIYNSPFITEDRNHFITPKCSATNFTDNYAGAKFGLKKVSTTQNEIFSDDHKTHHNYLRNMITLKKRQGKGFISRNVIRVPPHVRKWRLFGLKNFQNYVIYMKACREIHVCEKDNDRLEKHRCSILEMITVRTEGNKEFDVIPDYSIVNNKKTLKWVSPKHPNGLIVAFNLEYLTLSANGSEVIENTECLTYSQYINNGYQHSIPENLSVGHKMVRIQAISLFGKGPFTKPISLDVEIENTQVLLAFSFFLVFLIIIGIRAAYIHKPNNYVVVAVANPNYHNIRDHYEIGREDVEFGRVLGAGSFGKVYAGLWKTKNLQCAIKTVNEDFTPEDENEFLIEASVMKSMTNANFIVEIYGVVSKSPPLVLMELMEFGDLKTYLRNNRDTNTITIATMIRMALEIADGMAYMESHKFVHRDLAARNCMVNINLTVKVGDFGMARDVYENDYYRKRSKGYLPIRWMAPESLKDGKFTSQSDIWSYGVVLWEIVTMAEQPYQGRSNGEVLSDVIAGKRLDIPKTSPLPLKKLMMLCWKAKPSSRSTFMNIVGSLDYYHEDEFRRVSFYHSVDAVSTRKEAWEYVDMRPLESPPIVKPVTSTSYRIASFE